MEAEEGEVVEAGFSLVTELVDALDTTAHDIANFTTSPSFGSELHSDADMKAAGLDTELEENAAELTTEPDDRHATTGFF